MYLLSLNLYYKFLCDELIKICHESSYDESSYEELSVMNRRVMKRPRIANRPPVASDWGVMYQEAE